MCFFSLYFFNGRLDLTQSWAQQVKAKGNNKKRKLQFSFILCNVTLNVTIYICFLLLMIIMTICWRWSCWLVFSSLFSNTHKSWLLVQKVEHFLSGRVCGVVSHSEFFWEEKRRHCKWSLLVFCDAAYYGDLVMVLLKVNRFTHHPSYYIRVYCEFSGWYLTLLSSILPIFVIGFGGERITSLLIRLGWSG